MSDTTPAAPPAPQTRRVEMTITVREDEQEAFLACWKEYHRGDRYGQLQALRRADRLQGVASLRHLIDLVMVRNYTCGSSYTLAGALASIYNGFRVKANLYELGGVDHDAVEHLMHVIRLHVDGNQEIHTYFNPGAALHNPSLGADGNAVFERMITAYRLEKRRRKS